MRKIFITGISGTGKTTIAGILNEKGICAISIDEVPGLCCWKNKVTGIKIDYKAEINKEFIDTNDWVCDVDILEKLINVNDSDSTVVVLGIASNQNEFLNLFDKVLILQCSSETFIKRIVERKNNNFGKDKSAQEAILNWYEGFERKLIEKGAVSINAEYPVEKVVENIIKEI